MECVYPRGTFKGRRSEEENRASDKVFRGTMSRLGAIAMKVLMNIFSWIAPNEHPNQPEQRPEPSRRKIYAEQPRHLTGRPRVGGVISSSLVRPSPSCLLIFPLFSSGGGGHRTVVNLLMTRG